MQKGSLARVVVFKTAFGKIISVRSERLVSFHRKEIAAISYEICSDQGVAVTLSSEMVSNESNQFCIFVID